MHDDALGEEYLPFVHSIHLTELRLECVPALHELHWVAPVTLFVWNPAVQLKQPSSFNATGAYVPRGHDLQLSEL